MDDDSLQREEEVQAAAKKLGLEMEISTVENEWQLSKKGIHVGTVIYSPEGPSGGGCWLTTEGIMSYQESLKEALQGLAKSPKKAASKKGTNQQATFSVVIEFNKGFDAKPKQAAQMADLLTELAFAFRHKLTPDGLKFKRVVVTGPAGEAERKG